jgi:hypothetical protein
MGHKFGFYKINAPLEGVLQRTLNFWRDNRGSIVEKQESENKLFYLLRIKRDISAMSYGETYLMNIGYNSQEAMTYVSVEVNLQFGYGMQWLKPQGIMKKWAIEMGCTPMKLIRNQDPNFLNMFRTIKQMDWMKTDQAPTTYCPHCGQPNDKTSNFCKKCGSKLVD